ncbi:carboxylesterase type B [Nocardia tenerifensis]|uniref:Carboxylic ester hydrolase n=1 Tax=Nocardia tenerifensis TaxID=228006 RepID=A0A318JY65_9NOCA|nr:carboxylesterase family protein [Nocardia tenerifensis]PXX58796.1 carboxylesterase type B [Nocardia tenerifensis]
MHTSVVALPQGKVRGTVTGSVHAFRGIPYAAAPSGPALFQAPGPAPTWAGERDATEFGPTAPQHGYPEPLRSILHNPIIAGPEFLNLNVWTPDPAASGLPVMVWIHGGAFVRGSSAVSVYDGHAFARDGVVLVSLNYRLGAIGFAALDGAPPNRGILDQIAALRWVRDNIAAFGGDPGQVTIFGESAGGMSVATLLAAPPATGLFHRAIIQSGNATIASTLDDARLVAADFAGRLEHAPEAADIPALLEAERNLLLDFTLQQNPERWGLSTIEAGLGLMAFLPTIDGDTLTQLPLDAIAGGASRDIPLVLGTTTDEFRLFTAPAGLTATLTPDALPAVLAARGVDPGVVDTYSANRPGATPGDLLAAILTDYAFRVPTARLAEAAPTAYVYEFAWPTTHLDLRAAHALEIAFVFDTLTAEGAAMMLGADTPPQTLASEMHRAWVDFAHGRTPWEPYHADTRRVLTFDTPRPRLVADPRPDELALWHNR